MTLSLTTRTRLAWAGFALLLALAPQFVPGHQAVGLFAQMGIAIVACLSFNLLLGQGGMLSFGHAVYTGLGAYATIHLLLQVSQAGWPVPVALLPLGGGVAGLGFAAVFGFVTTRKSGTPFAMITLGLGELAFAGALMLPEWSGGEAGLSANRVVGEAVWGITWGPGIQVYYLIAGYTLLCAWLMHAFTRTPLGRLLNAVRDNPERVAFIGYDARAVRYLAFMVSGFFAGVAGGLGALWFEIVTSEVLGPVRSGAYLLFTFLGGAGFFLGPVVGGVLMVLTTVWWAKLTPAWLLYLGLVFMFMVMYAPGGLLSLSARARRWLTRPGADRPLWRLAALAVSGGLTALGAAAMVEMLYHRQWQAAMGPELGFLGLVLRTDMPSHWLSALALAGLGGASLAWLQRCGRAKAGLAEGGRP